MSPVGFDTYKSKFQELSNVAQNIYNNLECNNTYLHIKEDLVETFMRVDIKTPLMINSIVHDICIEGPAIEYTLINNERVSAQIYSSYARQNILQGSITPANDPIVEYISKEQFENEFSNIPNLIK